MTKIKTIARDNFTLKKAKISKEGVFLKGTEKRTVDGKTENIEIEMKAKYQPHPDLINLKDSLKPHLAKAYSLNKVFDMAMNYLASGKKDKVQELMDEVLNNIEVSSISVGGTDQLKGAVISGKLLSWNDAKCAINTPRIVFSSDKIGIETDVEDAVQLIESEVYKYFYEGKQAEAGLFDQSNEDDSNQGEKKMEVA